jgi:hypothetical protein
MKKEYTEEDMKNAAKKAIWDYINSDGYPNDAMQDTDFQGGIDSSIPNYRKTSIDGWWKRNKKYFGSNAIISRTRLPKFSEAKYVRQCGGLHNAGI